MARVEIRTSDIGQLRPTERALVSGAGDTELVRVKGLALAVDRASAWRFRLHGTLTALRFLALLISGAVVIIGSIRNQGALTAGAALFVLLVVALGSWARPVGYPVTARDGKTVLLRGIHPEAATDWQALNPEGAVTVLPDAEDDPAPLRFPLGRWSFVAVGLAALAIMHVSMSHVVHYETHETVIDQQIFWWKPGEPTGEDWHNIILTQGSVVTATCSGGGTMLLSFGISAADQAKATSIACTGAPTTVADAPTGAPLIWRQATGAVQDWRITATRKLVTKDSIAQPVPMWTVVLPALFTVVLGLAFVWWARIWLRWIKLPPKREPTFLASLPILGDVAAGGYLTAITIPGVLIYLDVLMWLMFFEAGFR
jgi:hypothetical protein